MTAGRQLGLVAAVTVLTMGVWFAASAVAPALRDEWSLSTAESTLLTTSVQLGFVVGAVVSAVLNLADVLDPPRLMAGAAVVAAASTAALTVLAHGVGSAVVLRLLTGAALAGVYPVGLKLASSWYRHGRGLALGTLVGALTLGSALPQLVGGAVAAAWRTSLLVAAALCLLGAVLTVLLVRVGPYTARTTGFHPSYVVSLARQRSARLANLGYLGHMWEVYALWVWLPAFLAADLRAHGTAWPRARVAVVSFAVIGLCGAVGCLSAGYLGDRVGRARVAAAAMAVSGCCCLAAAMTFGATPLVVVPLLAVWGAAVIADSAMFSACLSSVVDHHMVGTALTMQTAAGFLVTMLTIQGVPVVVDTAGWPAAVALLGLGPLLGAVAMRRLHPLLAVGSLVASREP